MGGRERTYTSNGETLTTSEWARRFHCAPETFRKRVYQRMRYQGMNEQDAINAEVAPREELAKRNSQKSPWRKGNQWIFRKYS